MGLQIVENLAAINKQDSGDYIQFINLLIISGKYRKINAYCCFLFKRDMKHVGEVTHH